MLRQRAPQRQFDDPQQGGFGGGEPPSRVHAKPEGHRAASSRPPAQPGAHWLDRLARRDRIGLLDRTGLRVDGGLALFGRTLPTRARLDDRPDHEQADLRFIRTALSHSQGLPTGGWYAIDDRRRIGPVPTTTWVAGRALVVWRDQGGFHAAPEACPHMGASLAGSRVCEGALICPWHGLALGPEGHRGFRHLRTHDDGLLLWVQLPGEAETDAPSLPERPAGGLRAVIRTEARCDPRDVIQNRLDPWHGAHFHPHSFARLHVIEQTPQAITVRVAYRLLGPLAIEVDARFHCPDARTIAMTIVGGEGLGSVVETHATPTRPGETAIIEATIASSERPGFRHAERLTPLLRPLMEWAAGRLWTEDADYAERLYTLRTRAAR